MPAKNDSGTEMTSAQGQLMTSRMNARSIQTAQSGESPIRPMRTSGTATASTTAKAQTNGV